MGVSLGPWLFRKRAVIDMIDLAIRSVVPDDAEAIAIPWVVEIWRSGVAL